MNENALGLIFADEAGAVIAADAKGCLRQVIGAERKEFS